MARSVPALCALLALCAPTLALAQQDAPRWGRPRVALTAGFSGPAGAHLGAELYLGPQCSLGLGAQLDRTSFALGPAATWWPSLRHGGARGHQFHLGLGVEGLFTRGPLANGFGASVLSTLELRYVLRASPGVGVLFAGRFAAGPYLDARDLQGGGRYDALAHLVVAAGTYVGLTLGARQDRW